VEENRTIRVVKELPHDFGSLAEFARFEDGRNLPDLRAARDPNFPQDFTEMITTVPLFSLENVPEGSLRASAFSQPRKKQVLFLMSGAAIVSLFNREGQCIVLGLARRPSGNKVFWTGSDNGSGLVNGHELPSINPQLCYCYGLLLRGNAWTRIVARSPAMFLRLESDALSGLIVEPEKFFTSDGLAFYRGVTDNRPELGDKTV
jgi:hypothetical protein